MYYTYFIQVITSANCFAEEFTAKEFGWQVLFALQCLAKQ